MYGDTVYGVALHGGWGRGAPAPAHAATTLVGGLVPPPREPTTAAEAFWKMPHKGNTLYWVLIRMSTGKHLKVLSKTRTRLVTRPLGVCFEGCLSCKVQSEPICFFLNIFELTWRFTVLLWLRFKMHSCSLANIVIVCTRWSNFEGGLVGYYAYTNSSPLKSSTTCLRNLFFLLISFKDVLSIIKQHLYIKSLNQCLINQITEIILRYTLTVN